MESLFLVAVLAMVAVAAGVRWWVWSPMVKRRVVAQLVDGTSIEGVVMTRRGPLLVLDDVTVRAGGSSIEADGRTVLDRSRVLWVQVITR